MSIIHIESKQYSGCITEAVRTIDDLANEAIVNEVIASPKPGLVDSYNSGAHNDMNLKTFLASADALRGYFGECFEIGVRMQNHTHRDTFFCLQMEGKKAEKQMFKSTGGINTHKGIIFSLGLLCGAVGRLFGRESIEESKIRHEAAKFCEGLSQKAFSCLSDKPFCELTKGERMYLMYGMTGARGEAEGGFLTISKISMPIFSKLYKQSLPMNTVLVETLLNLIAYTEDTNILSRHNFNTAIYARESARRCIEQGGFLNEKGFERITSMDQDFITKNISPGGSADLLAATYFLYFVQDRFGQLLKLN